MTLSQELFGYITYILHHFKAETNNMLVSHSYAPPLKASNAQCR
jgi:hypothetical protein